MNMVLGLEVSAGQTRKQACQQLLTKCVVQQGYTIGNLDTNTNTSINLGLDEKTGNVINYLDISGVSPLKGFLSESENSVYKAYGGEIVYNNMEINMVDERGTGNNIFIESGKNLEELQQDIDDTDTENFATAVLPCSSDGVYLPNSEIIYSPNAATLGKVFKKIVYDDVTLVDNTPEAFAIVYAQLRERVQKAFNDGLDKVKETNTIKYVQVMNTEEYKPYLKLFTEKCEIGNNVTVRYYMRNDRTKYIDAVGRIVKIKFNVLKNRIEEIEIGDRKKKSILDTINATVSKVANTNQKTNINKANIKIAEKEAKEYTNNLQVVLEKRDTDIEASVTNLETDTKAELDIRDGWIGQIVTQGGFGTFQDQTLTNIKKVVTSGSGFRSEVNQNVDSITGAVKTATGDHSMTLDNNGITLTNGGFFIVDSNNDYLFKIMTDNTYCIGLATNRLRVMETDHESDFYNTLLNMDIACQELKPNKLTLGDDDFYINDGYDLTAWIRKTVLSMKANGDI